MIKTLVCYATDYGNTKKMADVVAAGAQSVSKAQIVIKTAEEIVAKGLNESDPMIIGVPVYMRSFDWRIKKMIDKVCSNLWIGDKLVGKVGGLFACGEGFGNAKGGCEGSQLALLNNFAEQGLTLSCFTTEHPGYRLGELQWGPTDVPVELIWNI